MVTVANAKRVQNLLLRRQQITVSDNEHPEGSETTEAQTVEKTSPQCQPQPGETYFHTPHHRQPSFVISSLPSVHQSSGANTPQYQQPSGVPSSSPPLQQSFEGNLETPRRHQSSSIVNILPPSHQSSSGTNKSIRRSSNVTNSLPSLLQSSNKRYIPAQEATDTSRTHSPPHQRQHTPTVSRSSGSPHFEQATPQQEFSFFRSLRHCSDFDVSDLDLTVNPSYQLEMGDHVNRDIVQQGETSFSSLPAACSGCQPLLMSLNKRLCSLEAEFEKLKRKHRKGKVEIENEVSEKEDPNEEKFNGLTKEALVKLIEDATDAKSAVEALARQLYSSEELQNSSVTGFQCNKDYAARPGLSPSRRSILESIVLRKGFPATTRSSVRKDLGLVLKKARANRENKAKCKGQEQRKL